MSKITPSKRWCFTLFNQSDDDEPLLKAMKTSYLVYGREICPKTLKPHLQGFAIFSQRIRLSGLKKIHPSIHWEPANGTDLQASTYCCKDGDFYESNPLPINKPGTRTDWHEIHDMVKAEATNEEICTRFPGQYARNFAGIAKMRALYYKPKTVAIYPLYPWQQQLYDVLIKEAGTRDVIFNIDKDGNVGKSWFCAYFNQLFPDDSQTITPAKMADMAYEIKETTRVLFLDCSRSKTEHLSFDLIEQVKNGRLFSSKYESRMKYFKKNVHVVVMMNDVPDWNKLSKDRIRAYDVCADFTAKEHECRFDGPWVASFNHADSFNHAS